MKRAGKGFFAVLGVFFGLGFVAGFFSGFEYARRPDEAGVAVAVSGDRPSDAVSILPEEGPASDALPSGRESEAVEEALPRNMELVLVEHDLGSDENGVFLYGMVENRSSHAFDAVQVSFELYDRGGKAYGSLSDRNTERMAPGDVWGFTVYIPYSKLDRFSSYKLHGIVGTTRK